MNCKRLIFVFHIFAKASFLYCQNQDPAYLDSIIYSLQKGFSPQNHEEYLPQLKSWLPPCQNIKQIHQITGMLMDCFLFTGQYDSLFDIVDYGHKAGAVYRFPDFFRDSLYNHPRYKNMIAKNDSILAVRKSEAKPGCKIILPAHYNPAKHYPLFIVLTKGYRSLDVLMDRYRSEKVKNDFILAFIHSSDFRKTNFYEWGDKEKGR